MLLYFNVGQYGGTWRDKYFLRWFLVLKFAHLSSDSTLQAAMTRSFNNIIYNN